MTDRDQADHFVALMAKHNWHPVFPWCEWAYEFMGIIMSEGVDETKQEVIRCAKDAGIDLEAVEVS